MSSKPGEYLIAASNKLAAKGYDWKEIDQWLDMTHIVNEELKQHFGQYIAFSRQQAKDGR